MFKYFWWIASHGFIRVEALEGSKQASVLKKVAPSMKRVGKNSFVINTSRDNVGNPHKFFAKVNRVFIRHGYEKKTLFREKHNVARSFEELKNIPISVLESVESFTPPRKKKPESAAPLLKKIGIASIFDALFYLPMRYIDQTNPRTDFSDLEEKQELVVVGTITSVRHNKGRAPSLSFYIEVAPGVEIPAIFFRQMWLSRKFKAGDRVIVNGKFKCYHGRNQVAGTTIEHIPSGDDIQPVIPVYKQSPKNGLTTKFIESVVLEALDVAGRIDTPAFLDDFIPRDIVGIVRNIHAPKVPSDVITARKDMTLFELTLMQSAIQHSNKSNPRASTVISSANESNPLLSDFMAHRMPFTLTDDQARAVGEITEMMDSGFSDTVLLSADVGAGKTIIAQLAALRAVEAGHQAVMAAPTEVLAQQLYEKTRDLFAYNEDITVAFFTGSLKAAERKKIEKAISDGTVDIVIGTHVTLTKYEMYKSLGFVCIDEQHKFGASQRTSISKALTGAGSASRSPVVMQQTATPIPRSMAQGMFGGIHMIRLTQKPSGRLPIVTKWVNSSPKQVARDRNSKVWGKLREEVKAGNQAFIIAPFVTDSAFMEDVSSVESLYKDISEHIFPKMRVAMIHGKMKSADIDATMQAVRAKKFDIVIASTVVEVGVDIPDATFIAVMSADRLGIASLHQLRGRVGRSSKQSYCVLVSDNESPASRERMHAMEKTNDGFELAEFDLGMRGSGTIFGSQQAGDSEIRFATNNFTPETLQLSYERACAVVFSPDEAEAVRIAEDYFDSSFSGADLNDILI